VKVAVNVCALSLRTIFRTYSTIEWVVLRAGVSFKPEVYGRTDADVDVLRKEYTALSEDSLEDKSALKKAGPSILRTTPLRINTTPSRPHSVIPPKPRDGPPRGPEDAHYQHYRTGYRLGTWSIGQVMERIDTSGRRRDFDTHVANGVKLQQEAAAMDNDEKFAELTTLLKCS
jgi:hypothetical protein